MEQSQTHDIDGMPGVAGHIPDVVDDILDIADEEARPSTRPDDTTLLNLIGDFTPHLAIDFLNKARSLTQTELDTALIQACQYGFRCLVQKLVQLGADIECRDASGGTPLLICVENGCLDLVRFLVARKADVTVVDSSGNNALILSIMVTGAKEMTQFLLQQADFMIHHQNQYGCTAVMKALEVMDVGTVYMLLEQLSHTYNNDSGWTLLDQTVNCEGETAQQIAETYGLGSLFTLLKECLPKKSSLIQAAVGSCDLETVNFLLDSGIVEKNDTDLALLQLFIKYSENKVTTFTEEEMTMIKGLVECGADCNNFAKNYPIPCPLSLAVDVGDHSLVEVSQPINANENRRLSVAPKQGRLNLMGLLLKYNAEINTKNFNHSPLDCALIHGQLDCARFLTKHGANLDSTLALKSAMKNQAPAFMKVLFQHYVNQTIKCFFEDPRNGNNLLVDAVRGGNQEIIEQILQAGIDINGPQSSGATPIVESKNGAVAKFLIDRGADVNHTTNSSKRTPLNHVLERLSNQEYMYSNDDCIKEVILVLLEHDADVNARTSNGRTPLMLAATVRRQAKILKMLLDHGADCTARDNNGNTALIHAAIARCSDNTIFLTQIMKNNKDLLNAQNNSGITALMYNVFHGSWDIVPKLIDKGADVKITDLNGNTALFLAISALPEERFLKHLIGAGCNVNHQNNEGLSPLMLAVQLCKYTGTVPLLLASGADVNAVNHKDTSKTALSYFKKNLNKKAITCLEALLDKGADASYLSPCFLCTLISLHANKLIPKLIRCGLAPKEYNIDEMPSWFNYTDLTPTSVSPFCIALLDGNAMMALYFWKRLFLTNSDLALASNNDVRPSLPGECRWFLQGSCSRPMSLLKLCLVAVSSAVGGSPGREARVKKLPLLRVLKDLVLFKSQVPDNTSMHVGIFGLCQDSPIDTEDEWTSEDEYTEYEYSENHNYFRGEKYSD